MEEEEEEEVEEIPKEDDFVLEVEVAPDDDFAAETQVSSIINNVYFTFQAQTPVCI